MNRRSRRRGLRGALLVALGPLSSGCTLMALDRFELPRCTQNAQCEVLNNRMQIGPEACERYACVPLRAADPCGPRVCQRARVDHDGDGDAPPRCGGTDCDDDDALRAGAAREVCDGVDNNCNDVIDEGDALRASPITMATAAAAPVDGWAIARRPGGSAAVSYSASTSAPGDLTSQVYWGAEGGSTLEARALSPRFLAWDTGAALPDPNPFTMPGSMRAVGCAPDSAGCTLQSPSLALLKNQGSERVGVAAWIDVQRCARGVLRLAPFTWNEGDDVLAEQAGPPLRSSVAYGVDLVRSGTQYISSPECAPGARFPTVAALNPSEAQKPQALVVFTTPAATPGAVSEVRAVGVWLDSAEAQVPLVLQATHTARRAVTALSDRLGTTRAAGRVRVVAALQGEGYLVGWASAETPGAVQLVWVPPFATPARDYAGVNTTTEIYGAAYDAAPLSFRGLPAVPVPEGPSVDAVLELALGSTRDGVTDVAVAWARPDTGALGTAVLRVRLGESSAPELVASQQLARAGTAHVALSYAQAGFVRAGFTRGGRTADTSLDGGWFVAAGGARARVYRLLELDGRALESSAGVPEETALPGVPDDARTHAVGLAETASSRRLIADVSEPVRAQVFAAHVSAGNGTTLVLGGLSCTEAPRPDAGGPQCASADVDAGR